jgi:Fe-S-cluster containining protein
VAETFIPLETIKNGSVGFADAARGNPCDGCAAPCCRMLLIPHPTPTTFMDLDYIRYMLGFPRVGMVLNRDGTWQVAIDEVCGFLDHETNLCTVHGTERKPKTCVFFNPYRCWYKRNFARAEPPDLVRMDRDIFERILELVRFDEHGDIVELPTWETVRFVAGYSPEPATAGVA